MPCASGLPRTISVSPPRKVSRSARPPAPTFISLAWLPAATLMLRCGGVFNWWVADGDVSTHSYVHGQSQQAGPMPTTNVFKPLTKISMELRGGLRCQKAASSTHGTKYPWGERLYPRWATQSSNPSPVSWLTCFVAHRLLAVDTTGKDVS